MSFLASLEVQLVDFKLFQLPPSLYCCRAILLIAFKGMQPMLAKFTKDPADIEHECSVLHALSESEPVPGIVGPVERLNFAKGSFITPLGELHARSSFDLYHPPAIPGHGALAVKQGMLMPLYPATLQHVPRPMDEARVLVCGQQLKTTLQAIHCKGYGHNDIKAGNVFLNHDGEHSCGFVHH